ncbi:MAG: type IX secretion system membrane protein PorP/SprF [Bacteroidales bacterium]|nr:type IX secretion system membrane protein PorP/SprF [Bacteroidales bacterium]
MKRLCIGWIFILTLKNLFGQDPQFSQFYSNYLYLAPSFAGLTDNCRIAFNYRIQWPEIAHGYHTYSVSFDKYIEKFRSGLGVLVMQDQAGSGRLRSLNIGLQYSFDIKVFNKWHIRPGMHFLYTERAINFEDLLWNDQISASGNAPTSAELVPENHIGDIDFSVSALSYTDRIWVGACVDHLLKPNQSFYYHDGEDGNTGHIPIKYSVFGGTKFILHETLLRPKPTTLQLAFLYRQQKQFRQLDLGLYGCHHPFVLGFWYRGIPLYKEVFNRDAFTILAGLKLKHLNVGYSYDFTMSKLITRTGGSHEISLSYSFRMKPIKRRPKMIPCPDF